MQTSRKLLFSSDQLPAGLDDQARCSLCRELFEAAYGSIDLYRADNRPFSVRFEFSQFGPVGVGRFRGSIQRFQRTAKHIVDSPSDDFVVGLNAGRSPVRVRHIGHETMVPAGAAWLLDNGEAGEVAGPTGVDWLALKVPRKPLLGLAKNAESLVARPLDPATPALRYLTRYAAFLMGEDGPPNDPALLDHAGRTLTDLVALVLGPDREGVEVIRTRGLRAARIEAILGEIRHGFSNPGFSSASVGTALGLSARYVRDLLQETGVGLTERVLDLRLEKARAMLASPHHDHLKVSQIAYACGFNEVSYFNRCFVRRFGVAPTEYRRIVSAVEPTRKNGASHEAASAAGLQFPLT
jgi:AraC-like DNA-binding protein